PLMQLLDVFLDIESGQLVTRHRSEAQGLAGSHREDILVGHTGQGVSPRLERSDERGESSGLADAEMAGHKELRPDGWILGGNQGIVSFVVVVPGACDREIDVLPQTIEKINIVLDLVKDESEACVAQVVCEREVLAREVIPVSVRNKDTRLGPWKERGSDVDVSWLHIPILAAW